MDKFFSIVGALVALTVVCRIVIWWAQLPKFFVPLSLDDTVKLLTFKYGQDLAWQIWRKWVQLGKSLGYEGPVAWQVRAGFTFKKHAPKLGPCYYAPDNPEDESPEDWEFKDEPTQNAIVFWIPRLAKDSTQKRAKEQREILADMRQEFNLPQHHLSSYGNAALLAGLILAYYNLGGERIPQDGYSVRTDTKCGENECVGLGNFEESGLDCHFPIWDDAKKSYLGCFPLAVELRK